MKHSIISRRQRIAAASTAWIGYGLFQAWVDHVQMSGRPEPVTWRTALINDVSSAIIMGLFSPLVVWLAGRFHFEGTKRWRDLAVHAAGAVAFSAVAKFVWELFAHATGYHPAAFTIPRLLKSINWGMSDGVPLYGLIVFVTYASDYYLRYRNGLVKAADLNAQLARAQLQSLKMQLHPHFLFNTLHAISELIHEDAVAAERMIVGLAQLLRLSLDTTSALEVPLEQEMRFTQLYLDIEKMRFEDRLQIRMDIHPELLSAMVPNLILQPLVENAIKHGISRRPGQGRICIQARQEEQCLVLAVSDNGVNDGAVQHSAIEGIGHGTTRARLQKLYGSEQSFVFTHDSGAGAEAIVKIPLRLEKSGGVHELAQSVNR